MKQELSQREQINNAVDEVKDALFADLEAKEKIIEINREKTKTHYNLLKAKERLANLEASFN